MQRYVVAVICVVILAFTPNLVLAGNLMDFTGGTGSSMGFLGSVFGTERRSDPCMNDSCENGTLSVYAGYLDDPNGVYFRGRRERADSIGGVTLDVAISDFTYPVSGVRLGALSKLRLNDSFDFLVNGSYLIPSNRKALEVVVFPKIDTTVGRTFEATTQWWTVDGALVCNEYRPGNLIVGFRYDSFATNFKTGNPGGLGITSDEADLSITGYVPYAGLLVSQRAGAGGLNFAVIGSPVYPATMTWHATYNGTERDHLSGLVYKGYFLEAVSDYKFPILGGKVGLLISWSMVHVSGTPFTRGEVAGASYKNNFESVFNRKTWVFGGSFDLDFNSPI
jgi:hypothetical protein